ncbi:MAG TPA: YIP1 family protein [Pyrinomonadaceae bacterium]|nr:YIP1 family protein [Pyrinomonadaceae bacterium]
MSDPNAPDFQPPPPPPTAEAEVLAPRPTKLRPVAIGLFVLGLIAVGLGVAKVLPGGIGTGAAFAFFGILLFALSFIRLPVPDPNELPISGVQKLLGIFYEPTRVFRNLRSHPYWLAAFLTIGVLNVVYANVFFQRLTPQRIVDYTMEKLEQSPIKPPPEAMETAKQDGLVEATQPIRRVQTAAKSFLGTFVFMCFVATLCFVGVMAFGGRINFWQAVAATFYAALPVVVITKLLSLIILFVKAPEDVHPIMGQETLVQDNLGVLFTPGTQPTLFVLASAIGVLSFYGLWLRAKGLHNAGYKVSSSAAWSVAIILWVLGLILGAIFATLFSSFIS